MRLVAKRLQVVPVVRTPCGEGPYVVHKDGRSDPAWLPTAVHDPIDLLHVVPVSHPVTVANWMEREESVSTFFPGMAVTVCISSALERPVTHSKRFMSSRACGHRVGGKGLLASISGALRAFHGTGDGRWPF